MISVADHRLAKNPVHCICSRANSTRVNIWCACRRWWSHPQVLMIYAMKLLRLFQRKMPICSLVQLQSVTLHVFALFFGSGADPLSLIVLWFFLLLGQCSSKNS